MFMFSYLNISIVYSDEKIKRKSNNKVGDQTAALGLRRPSVVGVHEKIVIT